MVYKKIKHKVMHHFDRLAYPANTRSSNPFSTHLPVLASLSQLVKPKKILELGSGIYSSKLFLDMKYFEFVERVDSFENDEQWANIVLKAVDSNPKFHLACVRRDISMQIPDLNLEDYDLIFIDDSMASVQRCATIKLIASKKPSNAICVIHDYDHYPYREASKSFGHRFRFDALNPHTGVAWNNNQLDIKKLELINQAIKASYMKKEGGDEEDPLAKLESCMSQLALKLN